MLGAFDLGLLQLRRNRPYDAHRHLILQIENVLEIAFKALRPEMQRLSRHQRADR
jgi:hypothetical protein